MSRDDSFSQCLGKTLDRISQVEIAEGRSQRQRTRSHFVDRMTRDAICKGKSSAALSSGCDLSTCCARPRAHENTRPESSVRLPRYMIPQRLHFLSPGCQASTFFGKRWGSIRSQNSIELVGRCCFTVARYDSTRAATTWRAALAFLVVMARTLPASRARGYSGLDQVPSGKNVPYSVQISRPGRRSLFPSRRLPPRLTGSQ